MINEEILYSHQEANQYKTASLLYMPVENSPQNFSAQHCPGLLLTISRFSCSLIIPRSSTFKQRAKNDNKHTPNEDNLHTPEDPWQVSKPKHSFEKLYNKEEMSSGDCLITTSLMLKKKKRVEAGGMQTL